jgi:hypothetical protein
MAMEVPNRPKSRNFRLTSEKLFRDRFDTAKLSVGHQTNQCFTWCDVMCRW